MCWSQHGPPRSRLRRWHWQNSHTYRVLGSVCVCVHTDTHNKMFVIMFDLTHCSRQGYGYCDGTRKPGAILWATVIVSCDYLLSAPQQRHPPHFPTDTSLPSLHFTVDYPSENREESLKLTRIITTLSLPLVLNESANQDHQGHPAKPGKVSILPFIDNWKWQATPCFHQCSSWKKKHFQL